MLTSSSKNFEIFTMFPMDVLVHPRLRLRLKLSHPRLRLGLVHPRLRLGLVHPRSRHYYFTLAKQRPQK
jgi:hypothetical protein